MGKYIIVTAMVTVILMLGIFVLLLAVYSAGKQSAEDELSKRNKELEDVLRDYQDQLAQLRVERKLIKKGE